MTTMQTISPFLWFDGRAEEAAELYVSIFDDSRITNVSRYPEGTPQAGQALAVSFVLEGLEMNALNGGPMYQFTPAMSLFVRADTQERIDHIWDSLIADGGSPSRCGWLVDKFGLSWQVVPAALDEGLSDPRPGVAGRVMEAMMQMDKLDVALLKAAREG